MACCYVVYIVYTVYNMNSDTSQFYIDFLKNCFYSSIFFSLVFNNSWRPSFFLLCLLSYLHCSVSSPLLSIYFLLPFNFVSSLLFSIHFFLKDHLSQGLKSICWDNIVYFSDMCIWRLALCTIPPSSDFLFVF